MSMKKMMIFVNEGDPSRQKAESSVSRVLARYPGSILTEVDDAQVVQLSQAGFHMEEILGGDMIKLRSLHFDPKSAALTVPAAMRAPVAAATAESYWIVQFIGPTQTAWCDAIVALGGQIGDYVPDNAFLVSMTPSVQAQVVALDFVRWVGPYQPAFKISPVLMGLRGKLTSATLSTAAISATGIKPATGGNLKILLHTVGDEAAVSAEVVRLGGQVLRIDGTMMRVTLNTTQITALAAHNGVRWIEPIVVNKLVNDVSAGIMGVQPVRNHHGLDGEGQIVAVADTGLDTGVNDATLHDDFEGRVSAIHSWAIPPDYHPWLDNTSFDDGAADFDGHGTHVAGSVLGNGAASGGSIQGMAPAARLVFQAIEQYCDFKPSAGVPDGYYLVGIPDNLNTLFQHSYNDGARILTNSWGGSQDVSGNPIHGQYTSESRNIDEFMWNNRDALILFAAGNDGHDGNSNGVIDADSLLVQATAKNCLTVGASENDRPAGSIPPPGYDIPYGTGSWLDKFPVNPIRTDHVSDDPEGMAAFSSRGPTDDGRIKPDVVAPGTNILSVRSSVGGEGWGLLPVGDARRPFYMFMGGTSMATPLTAGTAALVRQYLQNACLHTSPSGALIKALIIHGAQAMAGQYPNPEVGDVPNNDEGWGRVNLERSLFPALPAKLEFYDSATETLATGDVSSHPLKIVGNTVPLRATLVWTDFPGTVAAGGALVNQLRLSLVAPDGVTVIQGSPANNNVQQVVIATPQIGTYTVRVSGVNVPTAVQPEVLKKQDFALVVTAGLEFVDVYIKDNPADDGNPPSTGCLYKSPDIWVSATNDPAAAPVTNPEYGQTNFVFVRVHNRGSKAANNATVKLYWANPGTNLGRPHWKIEGISVGGVAANTQTVSVPARSATGDGETIVAAFEWQPPDPDTNTVQPGHFCLFATISHPEDPILQEDVDKVRWEDNLAWKNEIVQDALSDSTTSAEFYVAGIPGASVGELRINADSAPAGAEIRLKIPARYWEDALIEGLTKVWESEGGRVCQVAMPSGQSAKLGKIKLKSRENTLVRIEVQLPPSAKAGDYYPLFVEQCVNGKVTGRVSLVARVVGTPAYIGNCNPQSCEIHLPNCRWVRKIGKHHRVPYDDLQLAIRRGYNGCYFCLPEFHTK